MSSNGPATTTNQATATSTSKNGSNTTTSSTSSSGTTMGRLFAAREWMSPTLKKSAFLHKGVLTPEEFVRAGDELVFKCPTWTWEQGDAKSIRSHLPPDKQYLLTRSVPCTARVAELETQVVQEENDNERRRDGHGSGSNNDDDDDWVVSQIVKAVAQTNIKNSNYQNNEEEANIEDDFDILDEEGEVVVQPTATATAEQPPSSSTDEKEDQQQQQQVEEEEEEYADMEDLEDDNVLEDTGVVAPESSLNSTKSNSNDDANNNNNHNDHIVKVRTYDLSITYDKYYQTPRLWMMGYDGNGQPLKTEEMMQDVMQDYAHKTVTMERHPHLSHALHASIHPCRHAQVMKTIVSNLMMSSNNGNENNTSSTSSWSSPSPSLSSSSSSSSKPSSTPTVESYLFIFLKFVSSIIPTINYDFTVDVTASTVPTNST